MGGSQTLNIAIPHLDKFAYVGVFSSGVFGVRRSDAAARRRSRHPHRPARAGKNSTWPQLDNAAAKKGLKVFWFSTGKDDGLIATTKATVDLFKKHGFKPVFKESPGGHTWLNWRDYLVDFAPQLFQDAANTKGTR